MHKAQKEIKKVLPQVDVVIEVLDARIPFSSANPLIAKLKHDKPCIKVLNKSDLADPKNVQLWQNYLEEALNVKTLALTTEEPGKTKQLAPLCRKMHTRANTVKKIRAMIVGIPNVGKSTLINILAGRAIAKTGNEPAVTKRQQSIDLGDGLALFDTPGILWPKQQYKNSSYRLGVTGAIKDTAMEYIDIAAFMADYMSRAYPENLKARYDISDLPDDEIALLEMIARRRGCLGRGGRVDLNKISERFIHDFRSGSLGKISLETPKMVEQETVGDNVG